jgi:hypothetical protein
MTDALRACFFKEGLESTQKIPPLKKEDLSLASVCCHRLDQS